jgi:glutathione synthase/RimK-type ligase-like ATP-grasp enzyme
VGAVLLFTSPPYTTLDTQVNTVNERKQKLRSINNHLKIFDDQNQCQQYISSVSAQNRIVLITNGQCGLQIVPHIHHFRQLFAIFIYGTNRQINERWARQYTKVFYIFLCNDFLPYYT